MKSPQELLHRNLDGHLLEVLLSHVFTVLKQRLKKNVCKESTAPNGVFPGGRVYLDLSKVTISKRDDSEFELTNKWWKIIVNEASGKKWWDFTLNKKGMVKYTCEFLHKMKQWNLPIKVI